MMEVGAGSRVRGRGARRSKHWIVWIYKVLSVGWHHLAAVCPVQTC